MLAHLCEAAQRRGLNRLCGRVVPTEKNAPARDLFEKHGFRKLCEDVSGSTTWELDLAKTTVQQPDWFQVSPITPAGKLAVLRPNPEPLHA